MWSDITSWIADKTAGLKILAADFNIVLGYIKTIYDNLVYLKGLVLSFESPVIGKSFKYMSSFVPIAADHPWFCLSYSDRVLSTANYPAAFIDEMRLRKFIYDEAGTPVSAYSGSWASNVFTLDNNTANNALLAELAEDWLRAGSPTTNWRILQDGTTEGPTHEFNITGISASARTITVNLDSKSVSGTSICIYLNRVYGSTTSIRHFSEAGLASYQAGGSKFNGALRRDKFQGHEQRITSVLGTDKVLVSNDQSDEAGVNGGAYNIASVAATQSPMRTGAFLADSANGTPRTGPKTQVESGTDYKYVFVGSYAA